MLPKCQLSASVDKIQRSRKIVLKLGQLLKANCYGLRLSSAKPPTANSPTVAGSGMQIVSITNSST